MSCNLAIWLGSTTANIYLILAIFGNSSLLLLPWFGVTLALECVFAPASVHHQASNNNYYYYSNKDDQYRYDYHHGDLQLTQVDRQIF